MLIAACEGRIAVWPSTALRFPPGTGHAQADRQPVMAAGTGERGEGRGEAVVCGGHVELAGTLPTRSDGVRPPVRAGADSLGATTLPASWDC